MIRLWPYLAAGAIVVGLSTGWYITSLKLDAAKLERDKAIANSSAYQSTLTQEREAAAKIQKLADENLRDLRNAKDKIDELRNSVESGESELHVNAECPRQGSVPASGQSSSASNDPGPRLSDTATRNYFTLQERHAEATGQIEGLQKYILTECQ